jgi:ABC-type Mn2+/Zn2+ transport system permease subunit
MTAQQRILASPGVRGRSIGFALTAAFGVGLVSGLAGPRFLPQPMALGHAVSQPVILGVAANNMSDAVRLDRLVHEYGGPLAPGAIIVNTYTGFAIGSLAGSPEVNRYSGFTTGWRLSPSR